jgi:hypothetical protein
MPLDVRDGLVGELTVHELHSSLELERVFTCPLATAAPVLDTWPPPCGSLLSLP